MGAVAAQIVRRIVEASRRPVEPESLLESVGLKREADDAMEPRQLVSADAYYDVLERCYGDGDPGLPFRYGAVVRPEDFGAFGLALKTARTVTEALERLVRYILVVTDTLEYQLVDHDGGRRFVLQGRPSEQRRGIQLANECALSAVTSLLRQVAVAPVAPALVSFRHPRPTDATPHETFFGCLVTFGADADALHFDERVLATDVRLSDQGLSAFLLAHVDQLRSERTKLLQRSLVMRARRTIADMLCDGVPRKGEVARKLGMSERTLQRRLAEHGQSFQLLVNDVRRDVAESLLSGTGNSLGEVAFLTGFSDQSAFQRAFKSWTGQTPLGFRQTTA